MEADQECGRLKFLDAVAKPQSTRSTNQSRTYLITGGAGFIGSHVSEELLSKDQHVLVIDNLSTGRLSNIQHLLGHPQFHFARASITDEVVLDRLASQSDVIIHLAAAVGVKLIVDRPVQTIETNVNGTEAVLKAALRYRCRTLIASTSEVYGKGAKVPFHEEDDLVLGPTTKSRWAYAASKMLDEFLGLAYLREYNLELVLIRLFNTVGPRQTGRYGMVVPRFVGQAIRKEPITVYGDGLQGRCFCDVSDAAQAIIQLANHPDAAGQIFNIGSTEEVTILELAQRVRAMTGNNCDITHIPYDEAYAPGFEDMRRRVPSIAKIKSVIGWEPRIKLDEILQRTIVYYQNFG